MHLRWPFVGRESGARPGRGGAGDPPGRRARGRRGVGKSRLLTEAVDRTLATGLRASYGAGDPVVGRRAPRRLRPAAAGRRRRRVPGRAAEAILARSAVVAIDDAHALDEASAAPGPPARDPGRRTGAGDRAAGQDVPMPSSRCGRTGSASGSTSSRSPATPSIALVIEALGGPVDARFQHLMWSRTLGNVLFARELLGAAVETGALTVRSGIWTLTGPFTAPARLRELIAGRLLGVRPDERTALDLLALGRASARRPAGGDRRRADPRAPRGAGLLVVDDSGAPTPGSATRCSPTSCSMRWARSGGAGCCGLVTAVSARPLPVEVGRPRRPLAHRCGAGRVPRRAADRGAALRPGRRGAGGVARAPRPGDEGGDTGRGHDAGRDHGGVRTPG